MKKLFIYAPALIDMMGHHFTYAKAIHDEAIKQGVNCTVFSRKELKTSWTVPAFTANLQIPFFTVKRLMGWRRGKNISSLPLTIIRYNVKKKSFLGRAVALIDILNILYLNVIYYWDTRKIFKGEKDLNESVCLFPDITKYFIFGFLLWYALSKEKPKLVLFYRHYAIDPKPVAKLSAWFPKIRFITDSQELADLFSKRTGKPFTVFPMPHIIGNIRRTRNKKRIFGYLGNPRLTKGADILLEVVKKISEDPIQNKVHFLIQATLSMAPPEIVKIVEELKYLRDKNPELITLIEEIPTPDEYRKNTSKMDVVIIPYLGEEYKTGTSGPLVDALVAGKPVIVPSKTWLARTAKNAGMTFLEEDPISDIITAIGFFTNDIVYKSYAKWARKIGNDLLKTHTAKNYVDKLRTI